jgi:Domain of unknown function (DUF4123)
MRQLPLERGQERFAIRQARVMDMPASSGWKAAAQAWFDATPTGHQCYALIDMANVHSDMRQTLATIKSRQSFNILGDERPDAQEASAWLMPLSRDLHGQRDFAATLAWADNSACATWLHSALPPGTLADALNERTKAVLPDNYPVLLRCYDPRVLPELHAVLSNDQARRYWALSGQWGYLDRSRNFRSIELMPASESAAFEAPLALTQVQADQLLAAAEVDTVMPELVRESPDAFLALPVAERAAFTRRTLRLADQFELTALADRVMFCVLTLELGAGFEASEPWAPLMHKVKHHQLTLLQAIQKATRQ